MTNDINSLKREMEELNSEISDIEEKNKKTTKIRNIKIFGKKLQKNLPYILVAATMIGTSLLRNQFPTVNFPFPAFLTNDGSNNVEVSTGLFYLLLAYHGFFGTNIADNNKDVCEGAITNIKEQYPLISDKELRHRLMEVRSEYRQLQTGNTK